MAIAFGLLLAGGLLAVVQGVVVLLRTRAFGRFARQAVGAPRSSFTPPATILLPCKGLDPKLEQTLHALLQQDYPDYEVICAVESEHDPAFAVIQRFTRRSQRVRFRCVVAQRSNACSQKVVNLLAAIEAAGPSTRVYAFLDSDAVPPEHWLAALVAPLDDAQVGAATGYRWYVPTGSAASLLRCLWNGSTLTMLGDHDYNFCWGGSTAIRRETFETLRIAERWKTALSEDFEITRAVNDAGLRVQFVPRCVLPSHEDDSFAYVWRFARRQMIITRVCHRLVWGLGVLGQIVFSTFWILVAAGIHAAQNGPAWRAAAALGLAAAIYALSIANGVTRQRAVATLLPQRDLRRGAPLADALAAPLLGLFSLALMAASACSNRFWWRGVLYDMQRVDRTRILRREHDAAPRAETAGAAK
jgi:hypothetical protein